MDLWRIIDTLRRKAWIITTAVLLVCILTAAFLLLLGREYTATVTVIPSPEALQVVAPPGTPQTFTERQRDEVMQQLAYLAKQTDVAMDCIQKLRLRMTPEQLLAGVKVDRPAPNALSISYSSANAEMAGRIANQLADSFAAVYRRYATHSALGTVAKLEGELKNAKNKVDAAQQRVDVVQQRYNVIGQGSEDVAATLAAQSVARQSQTEAQAALLEMEGRVQTLRAQLASVPRTFRSTSGSSESPVLRELKSERDQLRGRLARLLLDRTERDPSVVEARERLTLLEGQIKQEEVNTPPPAVRETPNPEYDRLAQELARWQAQAAGLRRSVQSYGSQLAELGRRAEMYPRVQGELAPLLRELNAADAEYTRAVTLLNDARYRLQSAADKNSLTAANLWGPLNPAKNTGASRLVKMLFVAFIFSFGLAVGGVLGWDYLDTRVHSRRDAETLIELPVTGVIPRLTSGSPRQLPVVTHSQPNSPQAEAYHFIAADLLLGHNGLPIQTAMVATARPGQGGSTTIANVAIALAQAGRRVVLVDADMRRPGLHESFNVPNEIGLSTVLMDGVGALEALQPTEVENLLLLPGGPEGGNPWQLLRSRKFRQVIDTLRENADFVLFDTPSAGVFADALVVAENVDGAIMAIRSGMTPTGTEAQIRDLLVRAGVPIVAVVLTDAPLTLADSARLYSDYYHTSAETLAQLPPPIRAGILGKNGRRPAGAPALAAPDESQLL
jgi:polysaccharide biosynthesis transport protein